MVFLRSVTLASPGDDSAPAEYPFSVPAIAGLSTLEFACPVTFFAGDNGTGKSTLLEAIAAAAGSVPARGDDAQTAFTLRHADLLADRLVLSWERKTKRGFFLRAEDFFDYSKRIARESAELGALAEEYTDRFSGYGRYLAAGMARGQQRRLEERYDGDLNARSHGESFLQFFQARFVPGGLYLLDEPDTALSTASVLALVAMLKSMVAEGAQFIVATHSPVLLALPGAAIVSFDRSPVAEVPYDQVEQVALLRNVLNDPHAFMRLL